ncbi:MAG: hypothetical protein Q8K92_06175 [Leadbetterella sp.]|nr:hypothetical protein [Leadbetterella sp.]
MESIVLDCERCNQKHKYNIDIDTLQNGQLINLICVNIKRLPRLVRFRVDFTKNNPSSYEEDKNYVSINYGFRNVEEKIKRKNEINEVKLWLIYDFDKYFEEIRDSYIIESFYPVATSCTALAERLVNLFIIKMRGMYDKSLLNFKLQEYVFKRDQNWQSFILNMQVLKAWGLLSIDQKSWFNTLLDIRNRAVHYQSTFSSESDSLEAIKTLHQILDSYFSPFARKDILRVFEVPGEIWVKEDCLDNPFVKAFVLPCCNQAASRGTLNMNNEYGENDAIIGDFSEEEFIEQRKTYKVNLNHKPNIKTATLKNKDILYKMV